MTPDSYTKTMTPDSYTIQELFVKVGQGHELYVHDWGNKDALTPIVFLHGGPGAGCSDSKKALFDPTRQRVVFFDQRGSGRSLPQGSREHNSTKDLMEDINKVADAVGLGTFVLTGRSWGSCLALAYALKHTSRLKALIIGGVFTGSRQEIDFVGKGGFRTFYPEAWEQYVVSAPTSYRHDPTTYHIEHALGNDAKKAKQSAYAYAELQNSIMRLDDRSHSWSYETFDPSVTQIELHYMANHCFMKDRLILDNAHRLNRPVWIIQGRYDTVCPPYIAYELHKQLPESQLLWTTGGHSGSDRETWGTTKAVLARFA